MTASSALVVFYAASVEIAFLTNHSDTHFLNKNDVSHFQVKFTE